jgi:hypothetical protein
MSRCVLIAVVVALLPAGRAAIGQSISADQTVNRLSDYVEQYYTRAQSIVTDESVTVQQIKRDLTAEGFARRLVYELRVEWDPSVSGDESPARVTRQLLSVNGKPPREKDKPECTDPLSISPEPLAFLLRNRRHKYSFTSAGIGRIDGREALMIDYRSLESREPKVEWKDTCVSVDTPSRGRLWADQESGAIIRLDENLLGMVDFPIPRKHQQINGALFMTLERADTSIRYRPVRFSNPDETLLLPADITSASLWRNAGSAGIRVTQSFSNYRRFVTAGRILR